MFIRKSIYPVHMANFLFDLGFLGAYLYGYATVSYNQIFDSLKFSPTHSDIAIAVLKVKKNLGKLILTEAIINSRYRRRLIVTHIKPLERVHKLGHNSVVHTFECVYLKIQPYQLSKCALYHKMIEYGTKLTTKDPSETNNNFENSYLKSNTFLLKIKLFTIFQLRLIYFEIKIILVLNILLI